MSPKHYAQIEDIDKRAPGHCLRVYLRTTTQQFKEYAHEDEDLYINICCDAGIKPLPELT